MQRGVVQIVAGYALWGLSPIFWKLLSDIDAVDVIALRAAGTLAMLVIVHAVARSWERLVAIARSRRNLVAAGLAAVLVSSNWGVYIWAVHNDRVTEAALGYFINPLVSVALGVLVLRERLRRLQWWSVGVAAVGVTYLAVQLGTLPWIPLFLATSFATYGLLRKEADYESLDGLTLESAILVVPAVVFVAYRLVDGAAPLGDGSFSTTTFVLLTGPMTAVPLLLFAAGARKVPLNIVGVAQFLVPTMQFLLGVVAYDEAFGRDHQVGYSLIWLGVIVFAVDSWRSNAPSRDRTPPSRLGATS